MPQIGLGDLIDVDAVVADLAVGNVVEPVDEVRNGGLAGAGSAHEGDLLAGMGIEGHVMQHGLLRHIAKVHVLHGDVALELRIGDGAVPLVGMLPGPVAGVLGALVDGAVRIHMGIDQGHVALVLLGLLVHQGEDALGTGQRHNNGVDLVGDLGDGHIEAPGEHHEGHQIAQGQQGVVGLDAQQSAHNGQDRILHIAQVIVDGAQHIGELAGAVGVHPQLLIELVEVLLADLLVVEDLDHLLAGDHLLDITVDRAQGTLLANKEARGLACQNLGDIDDQSHREEHDNGQDPGGIDQVPQHDYQGNRGGHTLGDGLGDHLPQGIDIAGVAGHDVTGGMAVEVAQRQALHLGEQIVTNGLLHTLGHAYHQVVEEEGAHNAEGEDAGQLHKVGFQSAEIRRAGGHHGQDIFVNQRSQGTAALSLGHRGGNDAEEDEYQQRGIVFHIAEQTQEGFSGVCRLAAIAAHLSGTGHQSSLPFC